MIKTGPATVCTTRGQQMDLSATVRGLLALSERDPQQACAAFDELVARYGRARLAWALQDAAGAELTTLGHR